MYANEKVNDSMDNEIDLTDYGSDKIKYVSNRAKDESLYTSKKAGGYAKDKVVRYAKGKYQKKKLIKATKKNVENAKNNVKLANKTIKKTEQVVKETTKTSKRVLEQEKKLAVESSKAAVKGTKAVIKVTVSFVKAIIAAAKSLITMLMAGGSLALIAILVISMIGLLVGSVFGIFFSIEKTSSNSITMKEVIAECNTEFSNKLESIQNQNQHGDYVLEGNIALWKDILLIYSVKQSNGLNQTDVITLNQSKVNIVKQIFWDMNEVKYEVKTEMIQGYTTDASELANRDTTSKRVLQAAIKEKNN